MNYQGAVLSLSDSCSEVHKGPGPFSEPETVAVSNFIKAKANIIKVTQLFPHSCINHRIKLLQIACTTLSDVTYSNYTLLDTDLFNYA